MGQAKTNFIEEHELLRTKRTEFLEDMRPFNKAAEEILIRAMPIIIIHGNGVIEHAIDEDSQNRINELVKFKTEFIKQNYPELNKEKS